MIYIRTAMLIALAMSAPAQALYKCEQGSMVIYSEMPCQGSGSVVEDFDLETGNDTVDVEDTNVHKAVTPQDLQLQDSTGRTSGADQVERRNDSLTTESSTLIQD